MQTLKIVQIILTNTSTLDTTLPALWFARQKNPEAKITILFCVGNKSQVLRSSPFIISFCKENNIELVDFSHYLMFKSKVVASIWRRLFRKSYNDNYSVKTILKKPSSLFSSNVLYIGSKLRKKLEYFLGERLVETNRILTSLQPDVVLWDLRQKSSFYGRDGIFEYLYEQKPKVILLPHSPHDITPDSEITDFDEKGEFFPDFCRYWIPFKFSEAWKRFEDRKEDFLPLGYGAFDEQWVRYVKSKRSTSREKGSVRCLIMTRNFFLKGVKQPDSEHFTVEYTYVLETLNRIAEATEHLDNIQFIIKPHPKASLPRTQEILGESLLKNWQISYESFYDQVGELDMVISNFTTSIMITQLSEIPTIVIEDKLQKFVNRWAALENLYTGMSLYCREGEDLKTKVDAALFNYDPQPDVAHLRAFFYSSPLQRFYDQIEGHYEKS